MSDDASARRPSIRDVARLAGVSHQTVSRVLNNHPSIRPETKERVLEVMAQLQYQPNRAARALVTSRSQHDRHPLGREHAVRAGVEHRRDRGGRPARGLLGQHGEHRVAPIRSRSRPGSRICGPGRSRASSSSPRRCGSFDALAELSRSTSRTSRCSRPDLDPDAHAVRRPDRRGAPGDKTPDRTRDTAASTTSPARRTGSRPRRGCAASSRRCRASDMPTTAPILGDWTAEFGYYAGRELLRVRDFTAIFSSNDQMALGLMHAVRDEGLDVPRRHQHRRVRRHPRGRALLAAADDGAAGLRRARPPVRRHPARPADGRPTSLRPPRSCPS